MRANSSEGEKIKANAIDRRLCDTNNSWLTTFRVSVPQWIMHTEARVIVHWSSRTITIGELGLLRSLCLLRVLIIIIRRSINFDYQRSSKARQMYARTRCIYVCAPAAFSIRTNGRIEFGDPAAFRFCANIDAPWRDAIALVLYAPSAAPLRTRVRGIEFWWYNYRMLCN